MQYVRLGNSGLKVSRLCLGMMTYGSKTWRPWVLEEDEARPIIRRAYEVGINFYDTADMYSLGVSEAITGKVLKELCHNRDDLVIASKVYNPMGPGPNQRGLSRKHILESIDHSLRRLGVDYLDLYQIHRWDYETPIEETLEALNDVVRAGKARYIGASSMWAWQMAKALYTSKLHGWAQFISMQNHYNLAYREEEREMNPLCLTEGIGLIPWSPLARGFLSGNRPRTQTGDTLRAQTDEYGQKLYGSEADYAVLDAVMAVATRHGIKPVQVALAWMLHKPGITSPIIGASKPEHLDDALGALEVHLSADDLDQLEAPYQPRSIAGHQ
jgi:aryl-alcohol dehydrogenase (NADP+)